jgi:hypothetical protein
VTGQPSVSAAVSEESFRNCVQRSYSACSPMAPAARARPCRARRKPRFGSCSQENGGRSCQDLLHGVVGEQALVSATSSAHASLAHDRLVTSRDRPAPQTRVPDSLCRAGGGAWPASHGVLMGPDRAVGHGRLPDSAGPAPAEPSPPARLPVRPGRGHSQGAWSSGRSGGRGADEVEYGAGEVSEMAQ